MNKPTKDEILKKKPSAYRSMLLSKYGYSKKTNNNKLKNWRDEKWINMNAYIKKGIIIPCGQKYKNQPKEEPSLCRPFKKVNKDTPTTADNYNKKQFERALRIKKKGEYIQWDKL